MNKILTTLVASLAVSIGTLDGAEPTPKESVSVAWAWEMERIKIEQAKVIPEKKSTEWGKVYARVMTGERVTVVVPKEGIEGLPPTPPGTYEAWKEANGNLVWQPVRNEKMEVKPMAIPKSSPDPRMTQTIPVTDVAPRSTTLPTTTRTVHTPIFVVGVGMRGNISDIYNCTQYG